MLKRSRNSGTIAALVAACAMTIGAPLAAAQDGAKLTASKMVEVEKLVGQKAPDFKLVDTEGKTHVLSEYVRQGKIVVLEWFNGECPYVVKHHAHNKTMSELAKAYKDKGVVWLAINSGHDGNSSTGADVNEKFRKEWGITYPILHDFTGETGRAYGSKNTPTMYVIDKNGIVAYAGAIDSDSSPNRLGQTNYVKDALDAVLAGSTVATPYAKPYGCSVKYGRN
ncbi:MAG: thioredoxin family protein [Phycisphaeraceae bacterium]|nr:thioredoxin family protein [Phycisphaeraceae bacterium]